MVKNKDGSRQRPMDVCPYDRTNEGTNERRNDRTKERTNEATNQRTKERTNDENERTNEPERPRPSELVPERPQSFPRAKITIDNSVLERSYKAFSTICKSDLK